MAPFRRSHSQSKWLFDKLLSSIEIQLSRWKTQGAAWTTKTTPSASSSSVGTVVRSIRDNRVSYNIDNECRWYGKIIHFHKYIFRVDQATSIGNGGRRKIRRKINYHVLHRWHSVTQWVVVCLWVGVNFETTKDPISYENNFYHKLAQKNRINWTSSPSWPQTTRLSYLQTIEGSHWQTSICLTFIPCRTPIQRT